MFEDYILTREFVECDFVYYFGKYYILFVLNDYFSKLVLFFFD